MKRFLLCLLILVLVGLVGIVVLAWRPAIAPITPPAAANFPAEQVRRGEVLAAAGYCATCHTAKGGARYAGNYPMQTDFGTIFSSNITPDPETGIGRWSEAAFVRAMRKGVARDGSHLFPAFPYQHFDLVSDEDLRAIYAYLMSQPPVRQAQLPPDVPFPLNWRALQAGWKLLFVREGQFGPVTGKDAQWNRGAYLAEGLGHCSACHSPRNRLGAEKTGQARYAGAPIDQWYAPPLREGNPAPVAWSEDELFAYLRHGGTALHGVAAGPMSPVIHDGLAKLSDDDVRAIAAYFADRFGTRGKAPAAPDNAVARAMQAHQIGTTQQVDRGANLYNAACASCHYNNGPMPLLVRPELGLNSALTADDPSSLIQIILHGIGVDEGLPGVMMPGFGHSFSNAQVAELAAWLRRTRTDRPPWPDLEQQVAKLRGEPASSTQTRQTGAQR